MEKLPQKGTKEHALADVLSRPNALNGLYKKLNLPLRYEDLAKKDASYITHVADWADKRIAEALKSGKDLDNSKVQAELFAAIHGAATGASTAFIWYKFLQFLGFRRNS